MVGPVLEGSSDNIHRIPYQSIGVLIYNALKNNVENKIILVDRTGEEITCETFLQKTLKLAQKLQDLGLKKGDVITIVAENQANILVTLIAGFYFGAKINLLNHDYTSEELSHFFQICKPTVVFCTDKTLAQISNLKKETAYFLKIILYEDFDDFISDAKNDLDVSLFDVNLEDVALLLTSSGTTGFPKCVQITHLNLRTCIGIGTDPNGIGINKDTVLLGYLPLFHMYGIILCLVTFSIHSTLVIMENFKPENFLYSIQQYKIRKLFVVPSILLFLDKSPLVVKYNLSSLKEIFCGGASGAQEVEEKVEKKFNVLVKQLYGMTETTGVITVGSRKSKKHGSVGVVVGPSKVRICNLENGTELSANEMGEVRIKGDGLMKGYLGNKEATREVFDEKGYLRSGDLGYYDEHGYLYIVGRLKDIFKYKGFQVSPEELESLLVQHPAIRDAGVVGKKEEKAGEVPVAFVVKQQNFNVTEDEIVKYVSENISVQKRLYGGVRFIDEIPKNATGKILRYKLKNLL